MTDFTAQAKVFEQIRTLTDVHDRDIDPVAHYKPCPQRLKAQGILMAYADIERLGWEEGDVVYPSKELRVSAGGMYKQIRVICECQTLDAENIEEAEKPISVEDDHAITVGNPMRERKRERVLQPA